MWAEAPRPYSNQDNGIPSGVPRIQDQTAQSIGGEESENQQQKTEQNTFALALPENDPRTELLRGFIQQFNRWASVFSSPEYYQGQSGDIRYKDSYSGEFTLVLTDEGYEINPEVDYLGIPYIYVTGGLHGDVYSNIPTDARTSDAWRRDFHVGIYNLGEGFAGLIDPYTQRTISSLDLSMEEYDVGSTSNLYSLLIDIWYGGDEGQAATFDLEKQGIVVNPRSARSAIDHKPEMLSGDVDAHAKALFDLVDSLIPQAQPQLPEPPTAGEQ